MSVLTTLHVVAFDAAHSGLPCRCGCGSVFHVPDHATLDDLQAVGRARNAHELSAHAYVHVVVELPYSYQSSMSKRGRSLLGKKH